jgi:predicted Fe-Mo cluster-binding NifX family protein
VQIAPFLIAEERNFADCSGGIEFAMKLNLEKVFIIKSAEKNGKEGVVYFVKIAVASEGGFVSAHFGHCPEFTLFTVDSGGKVSEKKVVPNPGHQPGFLPGYLAQMGITHIIAGGMGQHAQELFCERGVTPLLGVSGPVDKVVEDFLANRLAGGPSMCSHDGRGHGEGHRHEGCHGGGPCR